MVVPAAPSADQSILQPQVNVPGIGDPQFTLDAATELRIAEHFQAIITRSRNNNLNTNLQLVYQKCDKQFKKFLEEEFKEELALDRRLTTESIENLTRDGLVIPLSLSTYVGPPEYDEEFDITTIEVRFDYIHYIKAVLKLRTQIIITSTNPVRRRMMRAKGERIRGSILENKDGQISLSFLGYVPAGAFHTETLFEVSPDLETSERVKKFINFFPTMLTHPSNSLSRHMCEYLMLEPEAFSAETWRFILNNRRTLDPSNIIDNAVSAGAERIKREVPVSKNLNVSQMHAMSESLQSNGVYLLHGPPGTGKSKTLVSIIAAYIKAGKRILVCSHTNQAVDKLLGDTHRLGILAPGLDLRVGDPAHNDKSCLQYTIRRFLKLAEKSGLIGKNDSQQRDQVEMKLLANARSVFCTLTGTYKKSFICAFETATPFDVVIIDEASQAPLVHSLMPLKFGKRLILAGDHKQLPPCFAFENSRGIARFAAMFFGNNALDQVNPEDEVLYKQSLFERMLTKNLLKNMPNLHLLTDRLKFFSPSDFLVKFAD